MEFTIHCYIENEDSGMSDGVTYTIDKENPARAIEWYVTFADNNPYYEITIEETEEFPYITTAYRDGNNWEIHAYDEDDNYWYTFEVK